ncbi:unnamed protein product [Bubo scandiacus]
MATVKKVVREWDDHNSISASNSPADAAQDPVCLCCCSSTQLAHVQLVVHQDPSVSFSKAALQPHRSQPVLGSLVILLQVQDFAAAFVK